MTDAIDAALPFERERENQAWARWLARAVDSVLLSPFVFLAFAFVGVAIEFGRLPAEIYTWLETPILALVIETAFSFILFCLWEPLFLSNTGTTPGKWIMGVGVRRADGRKPGFFGALGRFIWVWTGGLGFGIPLVALILM